MSLIAAFKRLLPAAVTPEAIRLEIYLLGGRHRGEALRGARLELKAAKFDPERTRLLHAVIHRLS